MHTWVGAIPFVALCFLAAAVGSATTETGASSWYRELEKPSFQPPGWVFGPVWTLLYTLMGIAAWRVWRLGTSRPGVKRALSLFGLQLVLNAIWSPIFFGAHWLGIALIVLVALWLALTATIVAFRPLDRPATLMLVPYLAWVSFATVLNAAILNLN